MTRTDTESPSNSPATGSRLDPDPAAVATDTGYEDLEPLFAEWHELDDTDPRRAAIRTDIIRRSLPLADHIARRFRGRGEPLDDLVQVARIGLLEAVDRFDPGRGQRFLPFAIPTAMGEVRRYFRDNTWTLRVPRSTKELYLRLGPAVRELTQQLGRTPNARELARKLDADPADLADALVAANAYRPDSIDTPIHSNEATTPAEALGGVEPRYDEILSCLTVRPAIAELPARERQVLTLRFFGSLTQSQIADRMNISQMQVSRILARTLTQLHETAVAPEDDGSAARFVRSPAW